ncbi:hypothetical protein [Tateyamaria omphalii]|uniref:hypothetical protein n=1 Tax=Tateyamaria omphalii TaxID=299262 RepID=UPI0012FAB592|nr:hypothetical protein [Tateyamaria omphalii]
MRAAWEAPTSFGDGVAEVIGCVWEMNLIIHETQSWMRTLLSGHGTQDDRLVRYMEDHA